MKWEEKSFQLNDTCSIGLKLMAFTVNSTGYLFSYKYTYYGINWNRTIIIENKCEIMKTHDTAVESDLYPSHNSFL